jgi:Skp family chaperone for outer membrane proteins
VYEIESILNQMQQEASISISTQEQTMQITITTFLTKKLQEYSEENGIDIIFNRGLSGEGVLYGSDAFDITADVLEKLNATK